MARGQSPTQGRAAREGLAGTQPGADNLTSQTICSCYTSESKCLFFFSFFLRYREREEAYVATYGGRCW